MKVTDLQNYYNNTVTKVSMILHSNISLFPIFYILVKIRGVPKSATIYKLSQKKPSEIQE